MLAAPLWAVLTSALTGSTGALAFCETHVLEMASRIYIGKPSEFVGKTAFEILCNLKNFGVGRVLQRNIYKKMYPEPSFFKVTQVAPQMDDSLMYGRVWGIEVFRGKKYPYIRETRTDFPDYSLLRVHEEPDFDAFPVLGEATDHLITLPRAISAPPVMAELFNRTEMGYAPLYLDSSGKKDDQSKPLHVYSMEACYPQQKSSEFHYWYKIEEKR